MVGKPIPLRIDDETIERLDRLAAEMTTRAGGLEVARASVIRVAIDRGVASLEAEFGLTKKKTKKS
jgi:predicted transcriptional regulator